MSSWGIKTKVVMLGLLPASLIALLLGAVFITAQYNDLAKALDDRGEIITRQLAQASEFGVSSGNTDILGLLIQGTKDTKDIIYIAVNDQSTVLASVGRAPQGMIDHSLEENEDTHSTLDQGIVFHAPIFHTQVLINDDDMMSDESLTYIRTDKILGFTTVIISRAGTVARQQELIWNSLAITTFLLLLTGFFASYIGREVSGPIIRLTAAVSDMESGNLNARVVPEKGGELATLGRSFNLMGETLKQSQEGLQSKVVEATAQLRRAMAELEGKNGELEKQRLQAIDASQAKSQFLANMSHELRTPLNAIIGYSEMLREDAIDNVFEDVVSDLGKIHGAGNHLLALINDVLDLSKIEAGKMELYMEHFDVLSVIHDVTSTIKPLLAKNENELIIDCDKSIGSMYSDITKLRQSLLNLISNASKFTRKGDILIKVSRKYMHEIDWIEFSITDSGIGMTESQVKGLFQPFTQADTSTTRKFGGTGLGLTITKHFIGMMGGKINVVSQPDQGSTFSITLPEGINVIAVDKEEKVLLDEKGMRSGIHRIIKEVDDQERRKTISKVLCIDDDVFVRDLLKRFLGNEGFAFIGASTGAEGLLLAASEKPDVITLDIMMPEMDGWTVLHKLKSDEMLADIPVVIVSMVDEARKGITLGAADFLPKPVNWKKLSSSIKRSIRKGSDKSVLLIEDHVGTRKLMCRMLETNGWQVGEAENGVEGLKYLSTKKPAVILLDLMMPVMDGFEFIAEFNQHQEWSDIPVIILTAADLSVEQRSLLQDSVDSIIEKNEYAEKEIFAQVGEYIRPYLK